MCRSGTVTFWARLKVHELKMTLHCENVTSSIAFSCHSQRDHPCMMATWVRANASSCLLQKYLRFSFVRGNFPIRSAVFTFSSLKCVLIPQPFLTGMQTKSAHNASRRKTETNAANKPIYPSLFVSSPLRLGFYRVTSD